MASSPIDSRTGGPGEAVSELKRVGFLVRGDTPLSSTVAVSAVAAGQKDVELASATSFVDDAYAAIGRGGDPNKLDIIHQDSKASEVLSAKTNFAYPHAIGEGADVLEEVIIGEVEEGGVQVAQTLGMNVKHSGNRHGPFVVNPGFNDNEISFQALNASLDNLRYAFGLAAADGGGTGVEADPFYLDALPERLIRAMNTDSKMIDGRIPCIFVEGEYLHGGDIFRAEFWGCSPADGDRDFTIQVGDNVMVQFRFTAFANVRFKKYPAV